MDSRPNLVLFIADQWRGDVVGHMGNPAAVTPNLDRMVQTDAVSFRNAFCQNPVSTPSRCSFMSGWYPHVHGHRTMTHMLRPHEPMLLKTLKDAGYYVFWDGRNDTVPAQNGFEPFCNEVYQPLTLSGLRKLSHGAPGSKPNYSFYIGRQEKEPGQAYPPGPDWGWVMGAIEFLQRLPTDRPFCLYLSVVFPHPPYGVEEPWYSQIDRKQLPPRIPSPDWSNKPSMLKGIASLQGLQDWSEERWNELRATYYGMCARIDHQLGLVMDALRRSGHYDDTAVFVFSDHGDYTGDYGIVEKNQNTFEDCLTRVPFVIKPPASVPVKPRICNALVELIDMPATVEALAGITPQHTHFGRSLLPLVAGETEEHRDAVFSEGGRIRGEKQCMELDADLNGPYMPRLYWQRQEGPEHTKAVMCRTHEWKYVRRLYEQDELYNLRDDPHEMNNRINDPALASVVAQMKERMLTFFLETGDVVPFDIDRRF